MIVKEKAGLTQLAAEQSVLKLTHGDIGGWLARKWNLPLPYVEVMRLHHFPGEIVKPDPPSQSDTTNLICIVHAADALSKGLKDGKPDFASLAAIDPAVRRELKLEENRLGAFPAPHRRGNREGARLSGDIMKSGTAFPLSRRED